MTTNRLFAAADAKEQRRAEQPAALEITRGSRYALNALRSECETLATTPEGQRDHAINQAAYNMGTLIGAGLLDERDVLTALWGAARATGQPDPEIANALRNGADRNAATGGLEQGKAHPRVIVERDTPPLPPVTILDTTTSEDYAATVRERLPIVDWHELWTRETTEEWIIEPLLPARRLVALYSAPKVGKSLLILEIAVAVCLGSTALGAKIDRPRRVLYIDFENDPEADVRERLKDMGYKPDDLDNLCYLSFPSIAHLDSEQGSVELMAALDVYDCEVVVIDTVSRAVGGEENENDTWLKFYRHTGLKLKQAHKSLVRLDHSGKDVTKGQRGGSAKSGDVDAVWKLSRVTDDTYRLDCDEARFRVMERTLVLHRLTGPLHHIVDAEGRLAAWKATIDGIIRALDEAGVDKNAGAPQAREVIRAKGIKARNEVIAEAIRQRRKVSVLTVPESRGQLINFDGPRTPRDSEGPETA